MAPRGSVVYLTLALGTQGLGVGSMCNSAQQESRSVAFSIQQAWWVSFKELGSEIYAKGRGI